MLATLVASRFTILIAVIVVATQSLGADRTAVYVAPITFAESLALSALTNAGPTLVLPLGATVDVAGRLWLFEVAPVFLAARDRRAIGIATLGVAGAWIGAGPMFETSALGPGRFFLSPRIIVGSFWWTNGTTTFDYLLGTDFGYHLEIKGLNLSLVLGISAGLGINDNDALAGPALELNPGGAVNRNPFATTMNLTGLSFAVGFNFQLLRIGWHF